MTCDAHDLVKSRDDLAKSRDDLAKTRDDLGKSRDVSRFQWSSHGVHVICGQ